MKRFCVFFLVFLVAIGNLMAQFSSNGRSAKWFECNFSEIDEVFIFNGNIDYIEYNNDGDEEADFTWYKYADNFGLTSPKIAVHEENNTTKSTFFMPDAGTGYEVEISIAGVVYRKYVWVIDYSTNKIDIHSLEVRDSETERCKFVEVTAETTVPEMRYYTPKGISYSLLRTFKLAYTTLDKENNPKDTVEVLSTPIFNQLVKAPFCDTEFKFTGDQFAEFYGEKREAKVGYSAIAVQANLKATIVPRDAKNEREREMDNPFGGSAPLNVDFTSNAKEPVTKWYEWQIIDLSAQSNTPKIFRDRDLRYTFNDWGRYRVKLSVYNTESTCSSQEETDVSVVLSSLEVPNVFTPNGDGIHDEFRVAYKSLATFHGIVYNRWGRKVFEWTDPARGWDGRIGGKPAVVGAYYYIIEATGVDIDPETRKPMKYKKKGDINLIR